jgi:hypothetical protein
VNVPPEGRERGPNQPDFLLSHAGVDRSWAAWIAWQLEDAGLRVLVPDWDGVPGANWLSLAERTLAAGTGVLAVVSRAYLRPEGRPPEWRAAYRADIDGKRRGLIPIRVENCALPTLFAGIASIDLFDLGEHDATVRLKQMIDSSVTGRAKPAYRPVFPGAAASGGRSDTAAEGDSDPPSPGITPPLGAPHTVITGRNIVYGKRGKIVDRSSQRRFDLAALLREAFPWLR